MDKLEDVEKFVNSMCNNYNIDESHGVKHAIGTMRYANILCDSIEPALLTDAQREMAIMSAGVHDMCDHKYIDVSIGSRLIKSWLIEEQLWDEKKADVLIAIVTTMSYSKLKSEGTFPDHGPWQISYEIARNADLLEGYSVARCVLYSMHIHPEFNENKHWSEASELFEHRIFNYVKDGWITLPGALALVPSLEASARRCLHEKCME